MVCVDAKHEENEQKRNNKLCKAKKEGEDEKYLRSVYLNHAKQSRGKMR